MRAQVTKEEKARRAELEAAVAAEDAAISRLHAESTGLTAQMERLEAALADVGGPKLRKQNALCERLQQV